MSERNIETKFTDKVISIKRRDIPTLKQELVSSLDTVGNYFVCCETEETIMCYHSEMELDKLVFLQKVLNLYVDDVFRTEASYDE